jgi:hypothetical protein
MLQSASILASSQRLLLAATYPINVDVLLSLMFFPEQVSKVTICIEKSDFRHSHEF